MVENVLAPKDIKRYPASSVDMSRSSFGGTRLSRPLKRGR
jgi:hypothetical protein